MSSPSNIRSRTDQPVDINESASEKAPVTSSKFPVVILLAIFNVFLSMVKAIKGIFQTTLFLLLLPVAIMNMGTGHIRRHERAWAIFVAVISVYSMSLLMASLRISRFFWQVLRSMVGIMAYHQKYIMTLLNLDDSNLVTIGCYRKRGGLSDPHPETLSFHGFVHYQDCKGRQDGAYDQDERFLTLMKLIVVGLSICTMCLFLPLATGLVGLVAIPDKRFVGKNSVGIHNNNVDKAYQNGLRAGRELMEKIVQSLEAELDNIRGRIVMCTKYHKKEHELALQLTGLEKQIEIEKELLLRKSFDYDRLVREYAAVAKAYESIGISDPAWLLQQISDQNIEIQKLQDKIQELNDTDSDKELRAAQQKWKVKMKEEEKKHARIAGGLEKKLMELDSAMRAEKDLVKGTVAQANLDKKLADASVQGALGQVNNLQAIISQQMTKIYQHEEAMTSAQAEAMQLIKVYQSEAASKQALMDEVLELKNEIMVLKNAIEAQEKEINASTEERSKLWDRHKESLQGWQKEKKELRAANEKLAKDLKTIEDGSSEALERQAGQNAFLDGECVKLADERTHYQKLARKHFSTIVSLSTVNKTLRAEIAQLKTASTIPTSTASGSTATAADPSSTAAPLTTRVQIVSQMQPQVAPMLDADHVAAEQQRVDEQLAFMKSLSFDDA